MAATGAGGAAVGAWMACGAAGAGVAPTVGLVVVVDGTVTGSGEAATGGSTGGGGSGGGNGALLIAGTGWDHCSRTEGELVQRGEDLPSSLLCC